MLSAVVFGCPEMGCGLVKAQDPVTIRYSGYFLADRDTTLCRPKHCGRAIVQADNVTQRHYAALCRAGERRARDFRSWVAQREIHAGPGRRYAPAQKHKQTMASRIMPGNIPTNFSNSSVSNRGIKEQSKINCLADAHLLALKASTLRMISCSEYISHSVFISAISVGLASLASIARAMLV